MPWREARNGAAHQALKGCRLYHDFLRGRREASFPGGHLSAWVARKKDISSFGDEATKQSSIHSNESDMRDKGKTDHQKERSPDGKEKTNLLVVNWETHSTGKVYREADVRQDFPQVVKKKV